MVIEPEQRARKQPKWAQVQNTVDQVWEYRHICTRDRKGEFEPQLLKKDQTSITQDVEEKILSKYAKGMTTGDIEAHIRDIYGLEVSDAAMSRIADKILPVAKQWHSRPLESVYAAVFIFMDAIH